MNDEISKQKETIFFLDALLFEKIKEIQALKTNQNQHKDSDFKKLEHLVFMQSKVIDELKGKNKEFDLEVYLFVLFRDGTAEYGDELVPMNKTIFNFNSHKNREAVSAFRKKLKELYIIRVTGNATLCLVSYDEAVRILKKEKQWKTQLS